MSFLTGGSEKMTLTSSGNVGIGTTSPSHKLSINSGVTNVVATFKSSDNQAWISVQDDDSGTYGALFGTDTDAGHDIVLANKNATKRLVIDGNGYVGIGTTSPGAKLDVYGRVDFANDLRLRGTDTAADQGVVRFFVDSNNKLYIDTANDGSNSCLLYTSPSPRDGLLSRMPSSA